MKSFVFLFLGVVSITLVTANLSISNRFDKNQDLKTKTSEFFQAQNDKMEKFIPKNAKLLAYSSNHQQHQNKKSIKGKVIIKVNNNDMTSLSNNAEFDLNNLIGKNYLKDANPINVKKNDQPIEQKITDQQPQVIEQMNQQQITNQENGKIKLSTFNPSKVILENQQEEQKHHQKKDRLKKLRLEGLFRIIPAHPTDENFPLPKEIVSSNSEHNQLISEVLESQTDQSQINQESIISQDMDFYASYDQSSVSNEMIYDEKSQESFQTQPSFEDYQNEFYIKQNSEYQDVDSQYVSKYIIPQADSQQQIYENYPSLETMENSISQSEPTSSSSQFEQDYLGQNENQIQESYQWIDYQAPQIVSQELNSNDMQEQSSDNESVTSTEQSTETVMSIEEEVNIYNQQSKQLIASTDSEIETTNNVPQDDPQPASNEEKIDTQAQQSIDDVITNQSIADNDSYEVVEDVQVVEEVPVTVTNVFTQFEEDQTEKEILYPTGNCIKIFSKCDFQGDSMEACNNVAELENFHHPIHSVYIPDGQSLTIYDRPNFQGDKVKYGESQKCLMKPVALTQITLYKPAARPVPNAKPLAKNLRMQKIL